MTFPGRVALLLPIGLVCTTPVAEAKELAAACPVLVRMLEETDLALQMARDERDRGSALSAQQILRTTTEHLIDLSREHHCGAVAHVLQASLVRARAARTSVAATLTLDLGFSAMRSLGLVGIIAGDDMGAKWVEMAEAEHFAGDCPDLYPLVQRLDTRAKQPLRARASAVLGDLGKPARCSSLTRALTDALAEKDDAALDLHLDRIRLDQTTEADGGTPTFAHRCPELPMVIDNLRAAIQTGAPLYNRGDAPGCRDAYAQAVMTLLDHTIPVSRCPVARAELERGARAAAGRDSAGDAAWALRRSFDRIITRNPDEAPPTDDTPSAEPPGRQRVHHTPYPGAPGRFTSGVPRRP